MSLPEREPAEISQILARKAQGDATAMRKLAADAEIGDDIVGFHAQQAVEKWLKAVLANRSEEIEYTHDLHRLIMLIAHVSGEMPLDVDALIALTQYAVPLRYEDLLDAEPLDRDATVALVDEVGRWARAQLSEAVG